MNGFGRKGAVWGGAAFLVAALFFFSGNALADERLEAPSTVSETQEAGGVPLKSPTQRGLPMRASSKAMKALIS